MGMTIEITTAGSDDLGILTDLLTAAAPWAGADAVQEHAGALVLAETPVARRKGELTAALGADSTATAHFGSVLAAPGHEADLADLYAAVAEVWVETGLTTHTVYVPAGAAEAVWFDLSFGRQQAYAIATVADMPADAPPGGVTVARVGPEALDDGLTLGDIISRHQALSPVFSRASEAWYEQLREGWAEVLASTETRTFLARSDGEPAGLLLSEDAGPGLLFPPGAVELRVAAVRADGRGAGVGSALAAAFIADARAQGATHAVADWRTTNLLASRFWPRWGFRPVAYRLVRTIDLTPFA
jgi:ribosomal protein S18 acetylase RimI-like enzyme